jgi:glycosyltransferase involved in cell wall biosynthesis
VPASVFHDFVPMSLISRADSGEREPVVMLVGAPWFLKGADLLIEAFRRIAPEFPDVKVCIQGFYADQAELQALADGLPQVEIVKAASHAETLRRISKAMVLVLPSRSEGMGRVLLEAMAAGVPVVGSDAGGIPHYIRPGENGLVFPSGDSGALSEALRQLLRDCQLRERLGRRGLEIAQTAYNEQAWTDRFTDLVEAAVEGRENRLSAAAVTVAESAEIQSKDGQSRH